MSKRHNHNTRTKSQATVNLDAPETSKKTLTFSADSGSNFMDEIVVPVETQPVEPENRYSKQFQVGLPHTTNNSAGFAANNELAEFEPIGSAAYLPPSIKPALPMEAADFVDPASNAEVGRSMELYQSQWAIQPYPHPPLDDGHYHYLTTPPPIEWDKRGSKVDYAAGISWGPKPTPANWWVGWAIAGTGIFIAVLLVFFLFQQPDSNAVASSAVVTAVAATPTPRPTPTPVPAPVISAVSANEKWGMVTADNGYVRSDPRDDAKLSQTLGRNTLVAFEKKSNSDWYMLAGGGWLRADEIKTFPTQQAAQTAILLAKANVTVSVGASGTANSLPVPSNNSQASPQQLSGAGLLTYPAPACNIKAELNSQTGAKVYYLPAQQAYNSLSMLPADTHRWFCTEQDATRNGFTKSNSPAIAPTPTPAVVTPFNSPFQLPQTVTPKPVGY